ncbi:TPM domain-containing protein [Bifidobacterium lemurum]|uniref:TPM domain-containing protein n=1 Tax=Bifidobacterium lemurum TaxID=1603886 RepID=UPI001F18D744|nr:TPM domain-containing protein [Bifidobacterium lemurum]
MEKTTMVVPASPFGVSFRGREGMKWLYAAVCALLAAVLCMWITPGVFADDATDTVDDSQNSGITVTENITDTGNLLGSHVAEVTDAIDQVKETTGVTVRLMYLSSFNSEEDPATWAGDVLEYLDPDPNTVMLAVASNDGNLVVAVSSNSEEWLKSQTAVDALSDAAQQPLMESTPNWSQSAIAMMDEITVLHTSKANEPIVLGVAIAVGVVAVLVVAAVVVALIRRRNPKRRRHSAKRRRHSAKRHRGRGRDERDERDEADDSQERSDASEEADETAGSEESISASVDESEDDSTPSSGGAWADDEAEDTELQDGIQETFSRTDHS